MQSHRPKNLVAAAAALLSLAACSTLRVESYRPFPAQPKHHVIEVFESLEELKDRPFEKVGRIHDTQQENPGLAGIFVSSGIEAAKRAARKLGADALVLDQKLETVETETPGLQIPVPYTHKGTQGVFSVPTAPTKQFAIRRAMLAIRWCRAAELVPAAAPAPGTSPQAPAPLATAR